MGTKQITRREFLKGTITVIGAGGLGYLYASEPVIARTQGRSRVLKGFVVADAHFGWQHHMQPPSAEIQKAMETIISRFPDLDLFVDTGDAIHGDATDENRGEWDDVIQGGCREIPFFFTTGNHELGGGGKRNSEILCNQMGSTPCRPYYSYDIKGVHFVSLPELMMCSFITDEELAWLELDLTVNRDKTTIIFTHNSITGTTLPHDDLGYRRLANSSRVYDFIRRYPNIIAWMHGHNHTWEIVRKDGKLFVSNGRIGGFDPPYEGNFGKGHLGGMYFEVRENHVLVRGYSTTEDKFFDELEGYSHLTQRLRKRTSFDADALPCLSYGAAGTVDGQHTPVYNHSVLGSGKQELFVTGAAGPIMNENSDLSVYTQRTVQNFKTKHIPGFSVNPYIFDSERADNTWEWSDKGLTLLPLTDRKPERIVVLPENGSDRSYYQVVPGGRYHLLVEMEAGKPGPTARLRFAVYGPNRKEVFFTEGPVQQIGDRMQTFEAEFQVPDLLDVSSIYSDQNSDSVFLAAAQIRFYDLTEPVTIRRAELSAAGSSKETQNLAVTINSHRFEHRGTLKQGKAVRFDIGKYPPARSIVQVEADGNHRASWLIRQKGIRWQVRNTAVSDFSSYFEFNEIRNIFSPGHEVVIVPMVPVDKPYVHRLRNVNSARIYPYSSDTGQIRVNVRKLLGPVELEIVSQTGPVSVEGAAGWKYSESIIVCQIDKPGTVTVKV